MQNTLAQNDWHEHKQFKDPLYGYISLNKAYTKLLVDTQQMQRIKGVAQTGLRAVFSSATHDRFSHSLGVYKFGMDIYDTLSKKIESCVEQASSGSSKIASDYPGKLHTKLMRWKNLLAIACLLHDIGHPIQSHGFEFLYDDYFLEVCKADESKPLRLSLKNHDELLKECKRVQRKLQLISKTKSKTPKGELSSKILELLGYDEIDPESWPGNPHERMSAYYLLTDETLKKNIEKLICSYDVDVLKYNEPTAKDLKDDLEFIVRMIVGWQYQASKLHEYNEGNFSKSIQNCIIPILNGIIDADGMDYLMRNSYIAGFDTSKVDYTRLCNAYSVYLQDNMIYPAFAKSSLSVLEGYISARNYEPKWLYSHHKVIYADLLLKLLYKYMAKYYTEKHMLPICTAITLKNASRSAIMLRANDEQDFQGELLLVAMEEHIRLDAAALRTQTEYWTFPFLTYLLAPCRTTIIDDLHFFRMADADMDALIHSTYNELVNLKPATYQEHCTDISWAEMCDALTTLGITDKNVQEKHLRILCAEELIHVTQQLRHTGNGCSITELEKLLKLWIEDAANARLIKFYQENFKTQNHKWDDFICATSADQESLLTFWLGGYIALLHNGQPNSVSNSSDIDFWDFKQLLEEYQTRNYRGSLWKSHAEYKLFLEDCAKATSISTTNLHRYMMDCLEKEMTRHGFSIFDGKAGVFPLASYQEQFYYRANNGTPSPLFRRPVEMIKFPSIFNYKMVVKPYLLKTKSFDQLQVLFNTQPVPLHKVIDLSSVESVQFPYLYYRNAVSGTSQGKCLAEFMKEFIAYSKDKRRSEVKEVSQISTQSCTYRDAVHGDIILPQAFNEVVCTKEFQRLRRIRQLATADQAFPAATHTRFSHSLGTWYVMNHILEHFTKQLQQYPTELQLTKEEMNAALLAALLHDLGHGPYSHAFERATLATIDHEAWTHKIISDPETDVHQVMKRNFGELTVGYVLELLSGTVSKEEHPTIFTIYHALVSSQLDADRIDYILRDNNSCALSFGHIDMGQLIEAMQLNPIYGKSGTDFRLCFDRNYLSSIDQFIYSRFQMYQNVYSEPRKMLYEHLIKVIFEKANELHELLRITKGTDIIINLLNNQDVSVDDYLSLNDEVLNNSIHLWAAEGPLEQSVKSNIKDPQTLAKADSMQYLCQVFCGRKTGFKIVPLGSSFGQYDILAKRIGKLLDLPSIRITTIDELARHFTSFIFMYGSNYAYKYHKETPPSKRNILLKNKDDGTLTDYYDLSMFRNKNEKTGRIWENDYRYLFYSSELFEKECAIHMPQNRELPKCRLNVDRIVEEATPRKHIEIEKKYLCGSQELQLIEDYLKATYSSNDSFYTVAPSQTKTQKDTYIDTENANLGSMGFSLRCREKGDTSVFTIKTPIRSLNDSCENQVARHEFNLTTNSNEITDDVVDFVNDIIKEHHLADQHLKERDFTMKKKQLHSILVIKNNRTVIKLQEKHSTQEVCEICLDRVDYLYPDDSSITNGELAYQVEIELLAQPEYWMKLRDEIILPLEKHVTDNNGIIKADTSSKLELGLGKLSEQRK